MTTIKIGFEVLQKPYANSVNEFVDKRIIRYLGVTIKSKEQFGGILYGNTNYKIRLLVKRRESQWPNMFE